MPVVFHRFPASPVTLQADDTTEPWRGGAAGSVSCCECVKWTGITIKPLAIQFARSNSLSSTSLATHVLESQCPWQRASHFPLSPTPFEHMLLSFPLPFPFPSFYSQGRNFFYHFLNTILHSLPSYSLHHPSHHLQTSPTSRLQPLPRPARRHLQIFPGVSDGSRGGVRGGERDPVPARVRQHPYHSGLTGESYSFLPPRPLPFRNTGTTIHLPTAVGGRQNNIRSSTEATGLRGRGEKKRGGRNKGE